MKANNKPALGWSFRLGRLLGIDVYVHFTFLLLLGFIGLSHWLAARSLEAAVTGLLFFAGVFLCVLLHEYGHALAARRYGIGTQDITLLPIGGLARLERIPEKPRQELVVALAGPAVNVVIAAGLFIGLQLTGNWQPLSSLSTTSGNLVERLFAVNILLTLFNLLPAFPMDGGRVLRSLLAMRLSYARATNIAATIGKGMAVVFFGVGLFANPMLLLIAVFVWLGAAQEAGAVQMRSTVGGYLVREAMQTDFRVLAPANTLGQAAQLILAGAQRDFPVVEAGRVVGMLSQPDLFRALSLHGEGATVATVMSDAFETVKAAELLEAALGRMNPDKGLSRPVLHDGALVGLLTAENIGEFFMIRTALEHRRQRHGRSGVQPPPLPRLAPGTT